uniref:ATP synthase subunit delta', mitochondrial n=1 Tax=Solanum tuberosum TaxID=4113 RepID=M1AU76_SOLTU
MFRHGSRFLARATTMTWRRPFATDLQAGYVADSNFTEAWKKVVPNVDPPKTPSAFMAPRPATPSSIPSKLTVNFVLPYTSELSGKEVLDSKLKGYSKEGWKDMKNSLQPGRNHTYPLVKD